MTATEELRRMLDERGEEYTDRDMFGKHVFHWGTPMVNGAMFTDAGEWTELVVENASPEQAIEATLGRGECVMERVEDKERILYGWLECSKCGPVYPPAAERIQDAVKWCPFCGRKVMNV